MTILLLAPPRHTDDLLAATKKTVTTEITNDASPLHIKMNQMNERERRSLSTLNSKFASDCSGHRNGTALNLDQPLTRWQRWRQNGRQSTDLLVPHCDFFTCCKNDKPLLLE